jgi:hypothetical protein
MNEALPTRMTEKIEYKVNDPFGKPRPEGEGVITAVPVVGKSGSSGWDERPSRRRRELDPLKRSVRRTFRGGGR